MWKFNPECKNQSHYSHPALLIDTLNSRSCTNTPPTYHWVLLTCERVISLARASPNHATDNNLIYISKVSPDHITDNNLIWQVPKKMLQPRNLPNHKTQIPRHLAVQIQIECMVWLEFVPKSLSLAIWWISKSGVQHFFLESVTLWIKT